MRTGEVARLLRLRPGTVRRLTKHALPRPLPFEWALNKHERVFDPVEARLWDLERKDWWKFDSEGQRKRRRDRLEKKYGGKLGVTKEILDRWAKRGWR